MLTLQGYLERCGRRRKISIVQGEDKPYRRLEVATTVKLLVVMAIIAASRLAD